MEQSEGGEQSQPQAQPWGKLIRLGADEKEPHVLLLKREWTIGRKKGGTGARCAGLGRCWGTAAVPPPGFYSIGSWTETSWVWCFQLLEFLARPPRIPNLPLSWVNK